MNNKEIILPKKGRLMVVTDIHGNYDNYQKYLKLWNKKDKNSHIVFVGDLIHKTSGYDQSIEIMDDIIEKTEKYEACAVIAAVQPASETVTNHPITC